MEVVYNIEDKSTSAVSATSDNEPSSHEETHSNVLAPSELLVNISPKVSDNEDGNQAKNLFLQDFSNPRVPLLAYFDQNLRSHLSSFLLGTLKSLNEERAEVTIPENLSLTHPFLGTPPFPFSDMAHSSNSRVLVQLTENTSSNPTSHTPLLKSNSSQPLESKHKNPLQLSSSDVRERLKACVLNKKNHSLSSLLNASSKVSNSSSIGSVVATEQTVESRLTDTSQQGTNSSHPRTSVEYADAAKIHEWMQQVGPPQLHKPLPNKMQIDQRRWLRKTSSEPNLKSDPTHRKQPRLEPPSTSPNRNSDTSEESVPNSRSEVNYFSHPLAENYNNGNALTGQGMERISSPTRRRRVKERASLSQTSRVVPCRRQISKPELLSSISNSNPSQDVQSNLNNSYPFNLLSNTQLVHLMNQSMETRVYNNSHFNLTNFEQMKGMILHPSTLLAMPTGQLSFPKDCNISFTLKETSRDEEDLHSATFEKGDERCSTPQTGSTSTGSSISMLERQVSHDSPSPSFPTSTITCEDGGLKGLRRRRLRNLNRTLSAPLPLNEKPQPASNQQSTPKMLDASSNSSSLETQHRQLVKAQLREKVLQRVHSAQYSGMNAPNRGYFSPSSSTPSIIPSINNSSMEEINSTLHGSKVSSTAGNSVLSSSPLQEQSATASLSLNPFHLQLPNASSAHPFSHHSSTQMPCNLKMPSPIQEEKFLDLNTCQSTALAYDPTMLMHHCICGNDDIHPENPMRLKAVMERLSQKQEIISRCARLICRKATMEEIQQCHADAYTVLYGTNPINRTRICPHLLMSTKLCRLTCGGVGIDSDTVWNSSHTANAARMAAGCVIELTRRIALGDFKNGMALVRPPGHHAETEQALGFCYFNSIAIAARKLLSLSRSTSKNSEHSESLGSTGSNKSLASNITDGPSSIRRILIVDWDIHHGNGTQQIFYSDPSVLYISLHRYDNGAFFPGTGSISEIGDGDGRGFNINIAWSSEAVMSDAEYMAAFRALVLPIAKEFKPDLVLVSAGFDAAKGNPPALGGYTLSPSIFAWMTWRLCQADVAGGKVALVLEGGYDTVSLCDSVELCMQVLLQCGELSPMEDISSDIINECSVLRMMDPLELSRRPCVPAVETLLQVARIHSEFWQCLRTLEPLAVTRSHLEILQQQSLYFSTTPLPPLPYLINTKGFASSSEESVLPLYAMATLTMNSSPPSSTNSNVSDVIITTAKNQ